MHHMKMNTSSVLIAVKDKLVSSCFEKTFWLRSCAGDNDVAYVADSISAVFLLRNYEHDDMQGDIDLINVDAMWEAGISLSCII